MKQSAIYLASTKTFVELTGRRRHCKLLREGVEIPCMLVFSCSSKATIECAKALLHSKIRW